LGALRSGEGDVVMNVFLFLKGNIVLAVHRIGGMQN